jgi:hypothetical protein
MVKTTKYNSSFGVEEDGLSFGVVGEILSKENIKL